MAEEFEIHCILAAWPKPGSVELLFPEQDVHVGEVLGRVTLGFGSVLATSRTGWPISSQAAVSSVTAGLCAAPPPSARRMISTRKRLRGLHGPQPRAVQACAG